MFSDGNMVLSGTTVYIAQLVRRLYWTASKVTWSELSRYAVLDCNVGQDLAGLLFMVMSHC